MEMAQIKSTLRAQPFRPFTMRLVDGRRYFVPHPEFLYIPPALRQTVLFSDEEQQAVTILDALMIASIEFGDVRKGGSTNGNGAAP